MSSGSWLGTNLKSTLTVASAGGTVFIPSSVSEWMNNPTFTRVSSVGFRWRQLEFPLATGVGKPTPLPALLDVVAAVSPFSILQPGGARFSAAGE